MRWTTIGLAGAFGLLIPVWGWYYVSPVWTLQRMRAAALAHDRSALSSYVDYRALRVDRAAQMQAGEARLLAMAPPEVRGRVADSIRARGGPKELDRLSSPEWVELIFSRNPPAGWASGVAETGRRVGIVVRGPNLFRLYDRDDPYPRPKGDLTFRRHGLGWKLAGIRWGQQ